MKDSFGRTIDYMRISVTDRCNLRCRYCMPEGGIDHIPMKELLSYEEITRVCQEAAKLGIRKIRLTGGEPLVRWEIEKLVGMLRQIPGIESVSMTTNGITLKEHLPKLVEQGLTGVNISLDTLNPDTFAHITRFDQFDSVMDSIHAALDAGLKVKVNTVLLPKEFFPDWKESWTSMLELARELPLDLRFIELMPIGEGKQYSYITGEDVLETLQEKYPDLQPDFSVHGSGPAVYYKIPGFAGGVGLIRAMHGKFCHNCNRIRMSATGKIKPCLCYADTYDIRPALKTGSDEDVSRILQQSIQAKPSAHCFDNLAIISENQRMVSIGG